MKKNIGNRNLGIIGIAILLILFVVVVFLFLNNSQRNHSYYDIPVFNGKINWGMSKEEIVEALGEPTYAESNEYGATLTYDTSIPSEFGACEQLILFVGNEQEEINRGLCGIQIIVPDTTKESILDGLSAFYGQLSADGERLTAMEYMFSQEIPDFFYESHTREDWRLGKLPEEDYEQLVQFYGDYYTAKGEHYQPLNENDSLMYMTVYGNASDSSYICSIVMRPTLLMFYKRII